MKCIPISGCRECPHSDHKGAFGAIAYVPICRMAERELPHTVGFDTRMGRGLASLSEGFPNWCPLPDREPQP